jgi:tetratricopeptide (TPR) repeat protein
VGNARRDPQPSYGLKEAAALLGMSEQRIRGHVRAGLLDPRRGAGGELRFSFQDLAFLRLVKGLDATRIAPRRMSRALKRLKEQLPTDQPLSGVRLGAAGGQLVARRGGRLWNPLSGQELFDFEEAPRAQEVLELSPATPQELPREADEWYLLGCEIHEEYPERARLAYLRALQIDGRHAEARLNLGCLLHAQGKLGDAEAHYRAVLEIQANEATAAFDLGVVLEDQGRLPEACAAYEQALRADPACADAHYNLARLYERAGDGAAAIRHLRAYRSLTSES